MACVVPRDTPADPGRINDIPSAGPYYIASYPPRQQIVLRRNPNYHGDRPHRLKQIVVAIGVDPARALQQIEAGTADNALDGIPADAGPRLEAEYGPGSKAAKQGHQRYFVSPVLGGRWLIMNASRPLFSHVRLRRAVNYAIDRPALVAQGLRFANGSPYWAGTPSADYIPASMAGAKNFHLYPVNGPDLRRAKRIAGRGRAFDGDHVHPERRTMDAGGADHPARPRAARHRRPGEGVRSRRLLRPHRATRRAVRPRRLRLRRPPDPVQTLAAFDGSTIRPKNNNDLSYFNDPAFTRKLHELEKLSGANRDRAASPCARARTRRRSRGHDRDEREPRLLLGAERLPGVPARLRHRPRRPVPPEVTRLDCVPVAKIDASATSFSSRGLEAGLAGETGAVFCEQLGLLLGTLVYLSDVWWDWRPAAESVCA